MRPRRKIEIEEGPAVAVENRPKKVLVRAMKRARDINPDALDTIREEVTPGHGPFAALPISRVAFATRQRRIF